MTAFSAHSLLVSNKRDCRSALRTEADRRKTLTPHVAFLAVRRFFTMKKDLPRQLPICGAVRFEAGHRSLRRPPANANCLDLRQRPANWSVPAEAARRPPASAARDKPLGLPVSARSRATTCSAGSAASRPFGPRAHIEQNRRRTIVLGPARRPRRPRAPEELAAHPGCVYGRREE